MLESALQIPSSCKVQASHSLSKLALTALKYLLVSQQREGTKRS